MDLGEGPTPGNPGVPEPHRAGGGNRSRWWAPGKGGSQKREWKLSEAPISRMVTKCVPFEAR